MKTDAIEHRGAKLYPVYTQYDIRRAMFLDNLNSGYRTIPVQARHIHANVANRNSTMYFRLKDWGKLYFILTNGYGFCEARKSCKAGIRNPGNEEETIPYEAIDYIFFQPNNEFWKDQCQGSHETGDKQLAEFVDARHSMRHVYEAPISSLVDLSVTVESEGYEVKLGRDYYEADGYAASNVYYLLDHLGWPRVTSKFLVAVDIGTIPKNALLDGESYSNEEIQFMIEP